MVSAQAVRRRSRAGSAAALIDLHLGEGALRWWEGALRVLGVCVGRNSPACTGDAGIYKRARCVCLIGGVDRASD